MINHGSGIGLAITREFVRLHRGTIHVESNQDQGSIFIIRLPGVPADYSNVQISTAPGIMPDNPHPFPQHPPAEAVKNTPAPPLLLLVEDDDDFRTYLGEALKSQYDILEAPEGNTAWELVLNRVPDLIVSDIVMPGKSGIELCRQVKSDPRTLHIPVILLTAHSEEEQELLGYETGADAYLAKPFSLDMLAVRIQNLIRQREQFYQLLHRHIDINPSQISITPLDEQLINKAVAVVEKNIANADFSVEELSHALAMSRVYLYKKLSALTGKTPIEFIRVIRLKRAVQLLEKSQLTVAEVAYKVGFNNPKYFARYFREEFGVLPKAYQKKSKNGLPTEGNTVKGG